MICEFGSKYSGLQDVEVFLTELRVDPFSELASHKPGGLLAIKSVHCSLATN